MKTHILLDAANLFNRAKHATRGGADIQSGIALHVTLNSIKKLHADYPGSHLVVCLEGGSWRTDVYPEYKAHRRLKRAAMSVREKRDEEDFKAVMDDFTTFLSKRTNVTVLQAPGIEADDWIARWIDRHPDNHHVILSSDSDFYQLLAGNVEIYDGMGQKFVTISGIFDDKRQPLATKSKRKLKIKHITGNNFLTEGSLENVVVKGRFLDRDIPYEIIDGAFVLKKAHIAGFTTGDKVEVEVISYPVMDPQWELFLKIIRGDSSDNIFSAYPGVRENKIRDAYADRNGKGWGWNALMLQRWVDHNNVEHLVLDRYNVNRSIIDLRAQPREIIQMMDDIINGLNHERKKNIGIYFLKFCEAHQLTNIAKNPRVYTVFLSEGYHD